MAILNRNPLRCIEFHHKLMFFLIISIILQALLLAGCSTASPFGTTIYVSSFRYQESSSSARASPVWQNVTNIIEQATTNKNFQVRVNYFRLCVSDSSDSWLCASSPQHLSMSLPSFSSIDPLSLITLADRYRTEVLFPGLLIGSMAVTAIVFAICLTFPGWHDETSSDTGSDIEVKPYPNKKDAHACLALTVLSILFALTSALWQHTSAATATTLAEAVGGGVVKASVGSAATALVWLAFGVLAFVGIGFVIMVTSMRILDKLTELDSDSDVWH